jgi:putative holliday junction resolvase
VARMLGVDLGSKRIGLARSDPTGTIASPLDVLLRSGDRDRDHRAIAERARAEGAERIVVGFPLSLSGREGPAARSVRTEVAALRDMAGPDLPVDLHDERFTTVTAERALVDARMRRGDRRHVRDAVAAAVMLQSYLEATS